MRHSISLAHIITNPNVHTHGKSERKVRKPKTIPDRDATTECTQILVNITIVVVVHIQLQVSLDSLANQEMQILKDLCWYYQ